MESYSFTQGSAPPASAFLQLAICGALDEISNANGSVEQYIRGQGLVEGEGSKTRHALLFVVYETGRHGPQNGFRIVLVHSGFDLGRRDDMGAAEARLGLGSMEMIILGEQQNSLEENAQHTEL